MVPLKTKKKGYLAIQSHATAKKPVVPFRICKFKKKIIDNTNVPSVILVPTAPTTISSGLQLLCQLEYEQEHIYYLQPQAHAEMSCQHDVSKDSLLTIGTFNELTNRNHRRNDTLSTIALSTVVAEPQSSHEDVEAFLAVTLRDYVYDAPEDNIIIGDTTSNEDDEWNSTLQSETTESASLSHESIPRSLGYWWPCAKKQNVEEEARHVFIHPKVRSLNGNRYERYQDTAS